MLTEDSLNQVINNFSEYVIVINSNQNIVFQSQHNTQLTGFSNLEIEAIGIKNLLNSPSITLDEIIQESSIKGSYKGTETLSHKTKKYITVDFRVITTIDNVNKGNLFVFYFKNNTKQQLIQKDIIQKTLTIENLSKSRKIRDGKIDDAIYEILESSSRAMNTTRVNAWIFDDQKTQIKCIGNYDQREHKLIPQDALPRTAMPIYFNLIETEKIIITKDAFNEPKTAELYELYLKPNNIQALMDVPVRIEGEMIGVVCFENIGSQRDWTVQEQKYGLVAAQMLSLTIETHNKQKAKQALEIALNEQKTLLKEIHHRVKNNLSIIASLINLQAEKSRDDYHKQLFIECRNRLDSIAAVHELIYKSKLYSKLNFKEYLNQIIDHISASYSSSKHVKIEKIISDLHINITIAIPLALIVNELITNAYKHAFKNKEEGIISILLSETDNLGALTIKDNGCGFDKSIVPENSIGLDILNGLVNQISGSYSLDSNHNGTTFMITFQTK